MKERAALQVFLVVFLGVLGRGAGAAPAEGPLRVSPKNPRYFCDGSGKVVYLAGAHDGWELQDYAWGDKNQGVLFDWKGFLRFLGESNHNVIRLWCVEHTKITDSDLQLTTPMPYTRVPGRGTANDGGPRFDLNRLNQAYFDRLRSRVQEAGDRGIYVIIMLFQGWSIEDKGGKVNPWPYHPFHRANNINGVKGELDGDGQGKELHTWLGRMHPFTEWQRAYVRKVVDTVNDCDNVLYEIANESHGESMEWQYRMIEYIHAYEKRKPKQHPVGMTVPFARPRKPGLNGALFAGPADWISPNREAPRPFDYRSLPPPADGRKVVLSDSDHLFGLNLKDHSWVWKTFLRGHNVLYMDAWSLERGDPKRKLVRKALGHTRRYAQRLDLASTFPRNELASTRYCLAQPGKRYLVYLPAGAEKVTVDLEPAPPHAMTVEWFNPRTGAVTRGKPVQGGRRVVCRPPGTGDAVLFLEQSPGGSREPESR